LGAKAPAFRLQDETGAWIALEDLKGQRVVLFFFQKASTPGCTVEACEFRDLMPQLRAAGVTVLGISPDTWRRHGKFKAKERLPFALLADKGAVICQAYAVWHQKLFWGRHYMGVVRSTFVIGADGRLEREWRDVHHEGHAAEVSAWLRGEPVSPPTATPARAKPAARKK
jgi:peroxiredoxin Q/BCP